MSCKSVLARVKGYPCLSILVPIKTVPRYIKWVAGPKPRIVLGQHLATLCISLLLSCFCNLVLDALNKIATISMTIRDLN